MSNNSISATNSELSTDSEFTKVAEVDLAVTGMTCAACVNRVERKLNKHPQITAVVNLATEKAHLELGSLEITDDELVNIVTKAGYGATVINRYTINPDGTSTTETATELQAVEAQMETAALARVRSFWIRFWVALVLSAPIVVLSMLPQAQFPGWQWLCFGLSLPLVTWCAWPFHRGALINLRHGGTTMDTLVSLGVTVSFGYSLWALLFGGAGALNYRMSMSGVHNLEHHSAAIYFETAAMIITFLLLGRWLEARSRRSAGDSLRALLELGAESAWLVSRSDGGAVNQKIKASELLVGDVFRVLPGEKIATDGVVIEGRSAVDNALITGESVPVEVGVNDEVIGATINTSGTLLVKATKVGNETRLAQIGKLLSNAQTGKLEVQHLVDRISAIFVPAVLLISLGTFLVRYFAFNHSLELSLTTAITVLVVACPCALGLATPTALLVGSSKAASQGILLRRPETLESARLVQRLILDKTGTLTTGKMEVVAAEVISPNLRKNELLVIAANLEQFSEHPIAKAIQRANSELNKEFSAKIENFQSTAGAGVTAEFQIAEDAPAQKFAAGKLAWIQEYLHEQTAVITDSQNLSAEPTGFAQAQKYAESFHERGASSVVVSNETEILGVIAVSDTLRPEAITAIDELKRMQIDPVIVSGDAEKVARAFGAKLEISAQGEVTPEGKLQIIQSSQASGLNTGMVGDGVNDSAALAAADLSIAMGSGTDVAKTTADITIINSDIRSIAKAIRISRQTLRIIKENLLWAFGYNLIAIPLAIFGVIIPGVAAAAMASSSVIVVLNSLRLKIST
ncbi:MAG: cation-translocating P-type ATPase [Arcanobacterium sp.]|nr:cation-translocating P-type ATPase [Arcanobacterium sp.]